MKDHCCYNHGWGTAWSSLCVINNIGYWQSATHTFRFTVLLYIHDVRASTWVFTEGLLLMNDTTFHDLTSKWMCRNACITRGWIHNHTFRISTQQQQCINAYTPLIRYIVRSHTSSLFLLSLYSEIAKYTNPRSTNPPPPMRTFDTNGIPLSTHNHTSHRTVDAQVVAQWKCVCVCVCLRDCECARACVCLSTHKTSAFLRNSALAGQL